MKVKYEYCTNYNFRPDEMYGMGKESLRVISPEEGVPIEEFLKNLVHNSSIKHNSTVMHIYGSDETFDREDWKPWVGEPMFYITDIKFEIIDG